MPADITLRIYIAIGLISSIGTLLFIWWMIKYDWYKSIVFVYVTLLLMGEAIRSWTNYSGRSIFLEDPEAFHEFTCSWIWSWRLLLSLASVTALVVHMMYRAATKTSWCRSLFNTVADITWKLISWASKK